MVDLWGGTRPPLSTIFIILCNLWKKYCKQDCIPVGCVLPACWPYLPACSAPGGVPGPGGVCSGGVCTRGVCSRGDVCTWSWGGLLQGCLFRGCVCSRVCTWSQGGVCSQWGVSAPGGVYLPRHSPPVNRILDTRLWKYYLAPKFVCVR